MVEHIHPGLILQVTILLVFANGSPVLAKRNLVAGSPIHSMAGSSCVTEHDYSARPKRSAGRLSRHHDVRPPLP